MTREAALGYLARGLSVIPVHAPGMPLPPGTDPENAGKIPLIPWKSYQERRATEEEIRAWWTRWSMANVGIVTGAISGIVSLDVDGEEGQRSLRQFNPIPVTPRFRTGCGEQLLFRHPGGLVRNFAKRLPGLDFRGDGGYAVVPRSRHRNGTEYRWVISPDEVEFAAAPTWLMDLIGQPSERGTGAGDSEARWWLRLLQGAKQGERHDVAVRVCGHYLGIGWEPAEVEALLLGFAAQCSPPHDPADIRQIAADLAEREREKRAGGQGEPTAGKPPAAPKLVVLSSVDSEEVEWLWPGRIPRGKVTLLTGNPGVGKSWVLLDIGARVTKGAAWPDGGQAPLGRVVLLTAEDGLADTVRPRLDALGGDPRMVSVLIAMGIDGQERPFSLGADVAQLGQVVSQTGACLVIFDPLTAYLPADANSWKDADVRRILAPLAQLAEQHRISVVGVMHLSKDTQRQVLYRIQGSVAFAAAPRAIFTITKDEDKETRRLLVPLKLNLAPQPAVLAFSLSEGQLHWEDKPVSVSPEAALAEPEGAEERTALREAVDFLKLLLTDGPVPASKAVRIARNQAISEKTLRRAKRLAKADSVQIGSGKDRWFWRLASDQREPGSDDVAF